MAFDRYKSRWVTFSDSDSGHHFTLVHTNCINSLNCLPSDKKCSPQSLVSGSLYGLCGMMCTISVVAELCVVYPGAYHVFDVFSVMSDHQRLERT